MTILYHTLFEEKMADDLFDEKLEILPAALKERAKRFWRWQDAHASLLGKCLLLEGFKHFGISASLSDLRFTKHGKPYLADSSVCFNISHSGNCVVCVMSDEADAIGVDIEEIKPINIKGFRNYCTDLEWSEIMCSSPKVFYKYWTRKEAVLKADGRGLSIPLRQIEVCDVQVNFNDKLYFLNTCDLHIDYVLHLASVKDLPRINQVRVPVQDVPVLA